jgi:hypothetical protein
MTVPRWVAWILLVVFAIAVIIVVGQTANAENYGRVTARQQAFAQHAIHVWFDRTGAGSTMDCIARRESGYAATAYNDDDWPRQGVAGIFQIAYPLWTANNPRVTSAFKHFWHNRPVTWTGFRARLSDPVQSIRLAFILYRHSGLEPWGGGC